MKTTFKYNISFNLFSFSGQVVMGPPIWVPIYYTECLSLSIYKEYLFIIIIVSDTHITG